MSKAKVQKIPENADSAVNPEPEGSPQTQATSETAKKSKRVNVELAPGIATLIRKHIESANNDPDRTHATLTYTDVINRALDAYLPKSNPKS